MKWFKVKPRLTEEEVETMHQKWIGAIRYNMLENLTKTTFKAEVTHIIDRKIPVPITAVIMYTNNEGRRYQTPPINLAYRSSVPIDIPMAFITGRDEDSKLRPTIELILQYDPQDYRR